MITDQIEVFWYEVDRIREAHAPVFPQEQMEFIVLDISGAVPKVIFQDGNDLCNETKLQITVLLNILKDQGT